MVGLLFCSGKFGGGKVYAPGVLNPPLGRSFPLSVFHAGHKFLLSRRGLLLEGPAMAINLTMDAVASPRERMGDARRLGPGGRRHTRLALTSNR